MGETTTKRGCVDPRRNAPQKKELEASPTRHDRHTQQNMYTGLCIRDSAVGLPNLARAPADASSQTVQGTILGKFFLSGTSLMGGTAIWRDFFGGTYFGDSRHRVVFAGNAHQGNYFTWIYAKNNPGVSRRRTKKGNNYRYIQRSRDCLGPWGHHSWRYCNTVYGGTFSAGRSFWVFGGTTTVHTGIQRREKSQKYPETFYFYSRDTTAGRSHLQSVRSSTCTASDRSNRATSHRHREVRSNGWPSMSPGSFRKISPSLKCHGYKREKERERDGAGAGAWSDGSDPGRYSLHIFTTCTR